MNYDIKSSEAKKVSIKMGSQGIIFLFLCNGCEPRFSSCQTNDDIQDRAMSNAYCDISNRNVPIESTNEPVATLKHGSSNTIRASPRRYSGALDVQRLTLQKYKASGKGITTRSGYVWASMP
jgi:hypothetical protein